MSLRGRKMLMLAPAALIGMAIVLFIAGQIVMLLWNWLMPSLFGLPILTFWQAAGLLALCRILFGGSGFMRGRDYRYSPEQRERFRRAIRTRFGIEEAPSVDH